jgi:hypothetical protein
MLGPGSGAHAHLRRHQAGLPRPLPGRRQAQGGLPRHRPGRARGAEAPAAFPVANWFGVVLSCARAGHLTAKTGGSWPSLAVPAGAKSLLDGGCLALTDAEVRAGAGAAEGRAAVLCHAGASTVMMGHNSGAAWPSLSRGPPLKKEAPSSRGPLFPRDGGGGGRAGGRGRGGGPGGWAEGAGWGRGRGADPPAPQVAAFPPISLGITSKVRRRGADRAPALALARCWEPLRCA